MFSDIRAAGPFTSIAEDLIPYLRRVQAAKRDLRGLRDLNLLWQMIEATAAISCLEEAGSLRPLTGPLNS